jgi:hypothetical protein
MRLCGRAPCLILMGLLVATCVAGGAFASPGGKAKDHPNGKDHPQGQGHPSGKVKSNAGSAHGLAKGHSKHASAPVSPAPVAANPGPETESKPRGRNVAKPRPASRENGRAAHQTICHATGSGRYIVISPSVTGAAHHLMHHDDFVYVDGCERPAPPAPPAPNPGPHPPTDSDEDPPSVGPGPEAGALAKTTEELPFTGAPALGLLLGGLGLVVSGLVLRLRGRTRAGASVP